MSDTALFDQLRAIKHIVGSGGALPVLSYFLFRVGGRALAVATSSDRAALVASLSVVRDRSSVHFYVGTGAVRSSVGRVTSRPLTFSVGPRGVRVATACGGNQFGVIKRDTASCPRIGVARSKVGALSVSTRSLLGNVGHYLFTATSSSLHPMVGNICFSVRGSNLAFISASKRGLIHGGGCAVGGRRPSTFVLPGGPAAVLGGLLPGRTNSMALGFGRHGTVIAVRGSGLVYHLVRKHCPGCGSIVPRGGPCGMAISELALLDTLGHILVFSGRDDTLVGLRLRTGRLIISNRSVSCSASTRRRVFYRCSRTPVGVNFGKAFLVSVLGGVAKRGMVVRLTSPDHTNIVIPTSRRRGRSLLVLLVPVVLGSWGRRPAVGLGLAGPVIFFSLRAANIGVASSHVIRLYCVGIRPGKGRRSGDVHVGPRVRVPRDSSIIRNVCSRSITSYPAFGRVTGSLTGALRNYSLTNFGSGHFSMPVLMRRFLHINMSVSLHGHQFISMRGVCRGVRHHALYTTCGFCYKGSLRGTRSTLTSAETACRILGTRLSHCPRRLRGSISFLSSFSHVDSGISFTKHVMCSRGRRIIFGFKGCGNGGIASMLHVSPNCCD